MLSSLTFSSYEDIIVPRYVDNNIPRFRFWQTGHVSDKILKTLVLGIGNNILRDDGVGPAVIRELHYSHFPPGVTLETTSLSGLPLLDLVTGYDTLIAVDAIMSGGRPGEIKWARLEDFQSAARSSSQHRMDISRMLEIGSQMGFDVPKNVMLLTIEALDVTNFGEYLTPEVALAVPEAAAMILQQINNLNKEVLTSSSSQVSGKST